MVHFALAALHHWKREWRIIHFLACFPNSYLDLLHAIMPPAKTLALLNPAFVRIWAAVIALAPERQTVTISLSLFSSSRDRLAVKLPMGTFKTPRYVQAVGIILRVRQLSRMSMRLNDVSELVVAPVQHLDVVFHMFKDRINYCDLVSYLLR
jgi:hypothetical protein